MTTPRRIASIIYWKTEEERSDAQAKAEEHDESFSSFCRKLVRRSPHKK